MYNRLSKLCLALGLCSGACADEGFVAQETAPALTPIEITETPAIAAPVITSSIAEPVVAAPAPAVHAKAPVAVEKSLSPFTGKVKRQKVRLRANADLESRVVKELNRNDLLIVTGEKGEFYAVEPPAGTKAYVFRSFVLDGIVEGNRVNVRLEPSLDAPVIAHLNSGDRIKGVISSLNNKWYEITPPADTHFYIAKEYVESIGGPEMKHQLDKRKMAAEQLIDSANLLTKAEMNKPYNEIDIGRIKHNYETVINDYTDFPDMAEHAKEALATLQEDYLQKKISFLEERAGVKGVADDKFTLANEESLKAEVAAMQPTDRMKLWEPVEESLYLSWASRNDDRSIDEFYEEQKQNGNVVTGIVEAYTAPVKRKPGDFILRDKELPVAYIYSTQINLQDYVGKKVTIVVAPRNNNNFAFPAYYVLSVE
jgi:hypothetical protein